MPGLAAAAVQLILAVMTGTAPRDSAASSARAREVVTDPCPLSFHPLAVIPPIWRALGVDWVRGGWLQGTGCSVCKRASGAPQLLQPSSFSGAGVPSLASLSPQLWVQQGRASQSLPSFLSWDGNPVRWGVLGWKLSRGQGSATTLLPKVTQPVCSHPSPGNLGYCRR